LHLLLLGLCLWRERQCCGQSLGAQFSGGIPAWSTIFATSGARQAKVADSYRYMENLKDPEVQAWFKAQNDYTRAVLASIPGHTALLARIRELDQSVPQVRAKRLPGDLYFIWKPR
jgi:Prolyl oligopeptidase, N-terminal beta-propeller domain